MRAETKNNIPGEAKGSTFFAGYHVYENKVFTTVDPRDYLLKFRKTKNNDQRK
jgi:hypothetical protein